MTTNLGEAYADHQERVLRQALRVLKAFVDAAEQTNNRYVKVDYDALKSDAQDVLNDYNSFMR